MIPRRLTLVITFHPKTTLHSLTYDLPLAAQEGKRVVVIGSSFISMEIVTAINSRKLASIDVIGMEEFPFEAVLGKTVGAALKKVRDLVAFLSYDDSILNFTQVP